MMLKNVYVHVIYQLPIYFLLSTVCGLKTSVLGLSKLPEACFYVL